MQINFENMCDEIQAAVESGGTSEVEAISAGCLLVGNGMSAKDAARVIYDRAIVGDLALYVVELFGMQPWLEQLQSILAVGGDDGC